jgi:gluconate 2-dehydrogenase gamma chain
MTGMNRREVIQAMSLTAWVAAFRVTPAEAERAAREVQRALSSSQAYEPQFFTAEEWETVRMLVDLIIPADGRSGSATDAGVPEFMDFTMVDRPSRQAPMRGGLMWLDLACNERYGHRFVRCSDDQRKELLDGIAWPDRAPERMVQGVAFFNSFRDFTASGFFSSKIGVQDVQYMGNLARREWPGCPPDVLQRLGVSYEDDQ